MADVTVKLDWKGKAITTLIHDVVIRAANDTTAAAAIQAKGDHPGWHNQTGIAEGSLRGDPARRQGSRVTALFGSFGVAYFLWLEIGARGRAGDATVRRAADRIFPSFAGRIRALAKL